MVRETQREMVDNLSHGGNAYYIRMLQVQNVHRQSYLLLDVVMADAKGRTHNFNSFLDKFY